MSRVSSASARVGVLLLAALALAASTGSHDAATADDGRAAVGLAAPGAATASETAPETAAGPITLAFGGDVHFEGHVAALLRSPETSLASLRPYFEPADIAMVNLETAITQRGTPAPKEYTFRTSPRALVALRNAGVDVVTMANNHAVDFGPDGLTDTLAARRASSLRVIGIGRNSTDAYTPAVFQVRGREVAVLAASQIGDWTWQQWSATRTRPGIASARPLNRLLTAVRTARARADVVVVYLHWGTERMACPDGAQQEAARALTAAGADVVVGAHAHVVQGAGWNGRGYVAFGLGNFVWYSRASEASVSTGVLTLTVDGRRVTRARWTPLRVGPTGVPAAPTAATARRMLATYDAARRCAGLAAAPPRR